MDIFLSCLLLAIVSFGSIYFTSDEYIEKSQEKDMDRALDRYFEELFEKGEQ